MSLWRELSRRNVFKVAAAYLVAAWLIVQVIGVLTEPLDLPDVLDTVVVVLLAIGFPFALIVAWIYEVTPEGIKVTSDADPGQQAPRASGQRLTYVVIALLVAAVGLMALDRYTSSPPAREFGAGSRIAVLPCDDLSPDPTNSFFAVGIHEELLNRLAELHSLVVISRSSVQQYASRRPPIPQIADELGVDVLMECSARYAGDRVLLTAQLIDGASDGHLWSQAFPADMSDLDSIFEIQADIATKVATALQVEFLAGELERVARVPTQSREAYELYLASRNAAGPDALRLVERALELDDQFVEAWLAKAAIHNVDSGFRSTSAASAAQIAAAIEAGRRAERIDPEDGRVHGSLAFSLGQAGDFIGSELEGQRALELGSTAALNPFVKLTVGRFADVAANLEEALAADPMLGNTAGILLITYELLGNKEMRRHHWDRGEALYVDGWYGQVTESILRLGEGDTEFVRTEASIARIRTNPVWVAGIAHLDSPDDGIAALRSVYANPDLRWGVNLLYLTAWALHFDDPALALEWLREAVERQAPVIHFAWLPSSAALRGEPAFKDLLREIELPEYWDRFGWPAFCRRTSGNEFECD